jgi:hypothetical protein
MRKLNFFMVAVFFANVISPALLGGIPSDKAVYRGGTVAALTESTEGAVTTTDEHQFIFTHKKGRFVVPYERVNLISYGQKAGRRVGAAMVVALAAAPVLAPLMLLSKKRKHYLTIHFLDADEKQQAAVFELGKSAVRKTLASLEARTGKKLQYEDLEAEKAEKR